MTSPNAYCCGPCYIPSALWALPSRLEYISTRIPYGGKNHNWDSQGPQWTRNNRRSQNIHNPLWRTSKIYCVWRIHCLLLKETVLPTHATAPELPRSACDSLVTPNCTRCRHLTKGQLWCGQTWEALPREGWAGQSDFHSGEPELKDGKKIQLLAESEAG